MTLDTVVIKSTAGEATNADVIKLSARDYEWLKCFIIKNHAKIQDKSYFIVDDIDTELPLLLKDGFGLVYGVKVKDELIAVQAIDFNKNDPMNLAKIFDGYYRKDTIMEIGWAMVDEKYRGNGITKRLLSLLEKDAFLETKSEICAATVHPHNISSLFVFLKSGYFGYKTFTHYEKERMFLLKNIHCNTPIELQHLLSIEHRHSKQRDEIFQQNNICFDIHKEGSEYMLLFAKSHNNPALENGDTTVFGLTNKKT